MYIEEQTIEEAQKFKTEETKTEVWKEEGSQKKEETEGTEDWREKEQMYTKDP